MERVQYIPTAGWLVIGMGLILLFVLVWFRGLKLGAGDKSVSIGDTVDKKLNTLKTELEEKEAARAHDEEIRKSLFRESNIIDDKVKADMRRIVRSLSDDIYRVFTQYVKCEFPAVQVENFIKGELFQRIDENHMREKLSFSEISGYLADVNHDIHKEYVVFLSATRKTTCGEGYPSWDEISQGINIILYSWANNTRDVICTRTREKISLYKAARDRFLLAEYRKTSVDDPIRKNEGYLSSLEGGPV